MSTAFRLTIYAIVGAIVGAFLALIAIGLPLSSAGLMTPEKLMMLVKALAIGGAVFSVSLAALFAD